MNNKSPVKPMINLEWHEYRHRWWILSRDGVATAAIRFETPEINARRYEKDKPKHHVGVWNSWIKTESSSKHLTWLDGTPLNDMKRVIEAEDVRCH